MARPDDLMIGRTIAGKFIIESLIGSGAMGQVYRAHQVALEKTVALKVLHQDLARDEKFAARFHREAKAASRLDHPNSMRVIDFGADADGMLYIAMEYLDGRDLLRVIVEDGALSTERIVSIVGQALAALAVAHDMGVVHRDLKPENVMVLAAVDDEGRRTDLVKVCDFGIAKLTGRTGGVPEPSRGPITTAGLVVGTPEYMSPEQGRGDALDARSDLYSMGVILFHLLTGQVPFEAESVLGIVFKHVNEEPPIPSSIRPFIDPRLEAICLRALRKNRDDRYQSAREMRLALRPVAGRDAVVFPASAPHGIPPASSDLFQAKTVDMPGAPRSAAASPNPTLSRGTTGGTAALPPLPVSRPSIVWLAAGALLTGAAGTLLFSTYRDVAHAGPNVSPQSPVSPLQAGGLPLEAAATTSSLKLSSSSVASDPSATPSPAVVGIRAQPTPTRSQALAKAWSSHGSATATAPLASIPFSLTTSVANPVVQRSLGVSTRDVRAALPSWKFTQCYREAMQRGGKRIEGRATLSLTLDSSGTVTRVSIVGPPALLSPVGGCFEDAVSQLHVRNSSPSGATTDVEIVCTPKDILPEVRLPSASSVERAALALARALGDSKVLVGRDACAAYAEDDSQVEGRVPDVVVLAECREDIAKTLAVADRYDVPVTPRAAGSGRTGGALCIAGGVVLATHRLSQIKDIDKDDLIAVVEPRVITGKLHEACEALGLFYPPDPNSCDMCMIGGNVAENAGGPRAFKYGVTREYVLGLEVTLMGGHTMKTGRRTVKGVTGYDMTALLVGSEGTLGIFSEVTLRLVPKPPEIATVLALFTDVHGAGGAVARIVRAGLVPRCLELLDRATLDAVRGELPIDDRAGAMLLLEVDGEGAGLEAQLERLGDVVATGDGVVDIVAAQDASQRARLWAARKALSIATRRLARYKVAEDVVVPRSRVPKLLACVDRIGEMFSVRHLTYGHAGDGNLHVNFLWDDEDERPRVEQATLALMQETVALGGTLSGEHGIGVTKAAYLPLEQSDGLIALQRDIKRVFDPKDLLNPGKMFPTTGHKGC